MQYSQAKQGRVFVARLEHGEVVHEALETFALQEGIKAAAVIAVGAADRGSGLVVGPKDGEQRPVAPMAHFLDNVHEILAGGTIFPDKNGKPVVHIHMACGRESFTVTGCITGVSEIKSKKYPEPALTVVYFAIGRKTPSVSIR